MFIFEGVLSFNPIQFNPTLIFLGKAFDHSTVLVSDFLEMYKLRSNEQNKLDYRVPTYSWLSGVSWHLSITHMQKDRSFDLQVDSIIHGHEANSSRLQITPSILQIHQTTQSHPHSKPALKFNFLTQSYLVQIIIMIKKLS